MNAATTIKAALVSAMTELTGTSQPLKAVYSYQETSPRQYPCAFVIFDGMKGKARLDSHGDFLVYAFTIRVLLAAKSSEEEDGEEVEAQTVSITDAVITKFMATAKVDTLSGACEKFDITSGPLRSDNIEMPTRGIDFAVEAAKRISIV